MWSLCTTCKLVIELVDISTWKSSLLEEWSLRFLTKANQLSGYSISQLCVMCSGLKRILNPYLIVVLSRWYWLFVQCTLSEKARFKMSATEVLRNNNSLFYKNILTANYVPVMKRSLIVTKINIIFSLRKY